MRLLNFFSRDLGIDLGTANTLVYVKGRGIVLREPSVVAVRHIGGFQQVLKVGNEAKDMIGRTPGNIVAVSPMKDGVIADFKYTQEMLKRFMKKAIGRALIPPRVVICVPSGVTPVERKAVRAAADQAGAREKGIHIVSEPFAAAVGAGLPVGEPTGSMVVDIGGGTTEIAVISLGGTVASMSLRIGGNKMDDALMYYIKKEYNLMIGEQTAEDIKIQIGSAFALDKEMPMQVRGRDLVAGLPKTITITSQEMREAMQEVIASIIDAIKLTLEKTPPELAGDILDKGIVLTGGGALLKGLDRLISQDTGLPVWVADNPLDCVVNGAGIMVEGGDLDNLNSDYKDIL